MRQQAAPQVFGGNLLNFKYFISLFKEVVETTVDDPKECLTRLITYTSGEAKEPIKNCVYYHIHKVTEKLSK